MREQVTAAGTLKRSAATMALLMAVVALLALAFAGPLSAKPGSPPKAKKFTCVATVTSVDVDGSTITATVVRGTRAIRASIGSDVDFVVRRSTRIIRTGPTAITLADVAVGDTVRIRSRVTKTGVFRAALVVDRGPTPIQPTSP